MKVEKTSIEGSYVFHPEYHGDERGYFVESYNQFKYEPYIHILAFVQDNESHSTKNVLRGLHFQKWPYAQAKLVRCTQGLVYDVAIDLREDSPTYMNWYGVYLKENENQFFIPAGCAHGFVVLSDEATFQYKCDKYWNKDAEDGIHPFDPKFVGIWPEGITQENVIMSEKDKNRKFLD